MEVKCIIIDGYHRGQEIYLPYGESIRLPKENGEIIEYKECFRAVDKKVVLYSPTGNSEEFSKYILVL